MEKNTLTTIFDTTKKIEKNILYLKNTNSEPKISEIITFLNDDIILSTFDDSFKSTFIDNLKKITENINIFISWWNLDNNNELLLKNIQEIHEEAVSTSKNIYNDLFKDFLPKSHTDENWDKNINQYWKIAFLNKDFYKKDISKQWFEIMDSLYLLSINYLISYNVWLRDITKKFSEEISKEKQLDWDTQTEIYKIMWSIKVWNTLEDTTLRDLLFLIWLKLDKNIFYPILKNIKKWRLKTIESAIKKLLKSPKYRNQFNEEWILWDQLWFLVEFDSFDEIESVAKQIHEMSQKSDVFVWKFNDRWIIKKDHTNKDTLTEHPFVNIWFKNSISLWEISLRFKNKDLIENLINQENINRYQIFQDLILKDDNLNHEIYKISQDIKVIRNIFIDNEDIKKWTNFSSSVSEYLENKIDLIYKNIKKWIQNIFIENNISFEFQINDEVYIKKIILELLEEKIHNVINDIAWDFIIKDVKNTDQYKNQNNLDKRKYLKRISKIFEKNLNLWQNYKFWNYSDDIKKIFQKYKRKYNYILKSAFFLKETKRRLKKSKDNKKILSVTDLIKKNIVKKLN